MRLSEKKIYELIHFINHEIEEYQELIDAGYKDYYKQKYTMQDILDYVKDLFDVDNEKEVD